MPNAARKWLEQQGHVFDADYGPTGTMVAHLRRLLEANERLVDALEHCGYDPEDCIDCGGPPHDDTCRFWKLRNILSYWEEAD